MAEDFKALVGGKLMVARMALGMTQDDVAEEMACTRQTISSWEKGRTVPSLEEFRDLITLYGVEPHAVLAVADAQGARQSALGPLLRRDFADSAM